MVLLETDAHNQVHSLLQDEATVLSKLQEVSGIPDIIWQDTKSQIEAIVFINLDPTLNDVLGVAGKKLPVSVAPLLAEQLVDVHESG